MKTSLPAAALAAVVLLFVAATGTRAATFTNEADFITNIAAPYLVETFGSIQTSGFVASPTNFSGNGYSFDAITTSNNTTNSSLYGIVNGTNHWLAAYWANDQVVFTNFNLNASAIGGYFFLTDDSAAFTSGAIYLTAQLSDSTLITTNISPASATSFFGFTFATNVISFSIGSTNVSEKYPTAAKVIAGTTIPEPSSLALLLLGAGAAALLVFKTRRA